MGGVQNLVELGDIAIDARSTSSGLAYRLDGSALAFQSIPRAETRPAVFQRANSRFIRPIGSERPTSIAEGELEMTTEWSWSKRKFADRRS